MKKLSFFAFVLVALSALYFVACQKDTEAQAANEVSVNQEEVVDRMPLILGTVTTNCICGDKQCSLMSIGTTQRNAINIALNSLTHNYYNVNGPGLTYTIYPGNNCSGTPVANFTCSLANVTFATGSLTNNTTYSVKISSGSASSPCYVITTGNCAGVPCSYTGIK